MSWQKCPVCEGRTTVPIGFYTPGVGVGAGPEAREKCRSCDGKGVLLVASFPAEPLTLMKFGPGFYPPAFQLPGFDDPAPWTGDEVPHPYEGTCGSGRAP